MSLRAIDRVYPGFALIGSGGGGGGGGNGSLDTVVQTLNAGSNDVSHSLGVEPTAWLIQDSSGRTLVLAAEPKVGSETSVLEVTGIKLETDAQITVFAESGGGGSTTKETITQSLAIGSNDVNHTLGVVPTLWIIQNEDGQILLYAAEPKVGSETSVLEIDSLDVTPNAKITVFA